MNRCVVVVIVAALMISCSQEPWPEAAVAPPLPADMSTFDAAIAEQIDAEVEALHRDPHDATRWRELGMLYHAHDQFDLAVECYRQSLALAADNAQTHYYLALAEHRRGRTGEAIAAIRQSTELDTSYGAARWRLGLWLLEDGDLTAARSAAEDAFAMASGDRAATLVLARIHLQVGEPEKASELLETHLETRADDAYAHFLLAGAYRRLGRSDDARGHAIRGQAAEPGWSDPWFDDIQAKRAGFPAALAKATDLLADDPGRAVEALEQLRKERPDNGTVLINLGIGYRVIGRLEDSAEALRDAVQFESTRGLAHFHLAVTYAQQSRDSAHGELLAMALEHVGRVLELQPTSARAHALQGELLAQAGRLAAAVESYRKAVRDPQDTAWLYRLGGLLCQLQRWQEAIPILEGFLEHVPGNADARFLLGVAQANAGRFDDAAENLEQVRQVRPADPRIQQALLQLERARTATKEK